MRQNSVLYEPSGGSAPDIAGKGNCKSDRNDLISAAMMLRYSFDLDKEADAVENAVKQVLKDRTTARLTLCRRRQSAQEK